MLATLATWLLLQTCGAPPSRASNHYWDHLKRCGCEGADWPSRASSDYKRFVAICGESPAEPLAYCDEEPQPSVVPDPKCGFPPSRASLGYWDHLERCGCAGADPPSHASNDYQRFEKICGPPPSSLVIR